MLLLCKPASITCRLLTPLLCMSLLYAFCFFNSFAKPSVNASLDVSDSTQGYQDSDFSPNKIMRKRKLSLPTVLTKNRVKHRNNPGRKLLVLNQENSSDSSHSMCTRARNQTVKSSSGIYKSDSYLQLFANNRSLKKLEKIDENIPIGKNAIADLQHLDTNCSNSNDLTDYSHSSQNIGSSSNVSLPQSPELSLVETISVCKDLISSGEEHALINQMQENNFNKNAEQSVYQITEVDVTVPLMEQLSEVKVSNGIAPNVSKKAVVSESLLNKIGTVGIRDSTSISDGLDKRLSELLLESAKKISTNYENMEIEGVGNENILGQAKKLKAKKRCSTPRKKKEKKTTKSPNVETVIEHMEYSRSGAKSCPPSIHIIDENAMDCDDNDHFSKTEKVRKKKDVIKVKILRPRQKSCSEEKTKLFNEINEMSVCSDSGINATEMDGLFPLDGSVDLIHNHSETCLHANECATDSVEFVDISNTIVSLNTDSNLTQGWTQDIGYEDAETMLADLVNDIEDLEMYAESKADEQGTGKANSDDNPLTNFGVTDINEAINASLMTEDLSDESPTLPNSNTKTSKWYLFSEDETTNVNVNEYRTNTGGSGSNLYQIFPITCAIPDLSTISEMSKDNEESRKTNLNYAAGDSQNII